jgi:dTDP-4-dehydrorhamnose reductase
MKFLLIQENNTLFSALRMAASRREEEIVPVPVSWRSLASVVDLEELIELHKPAYILFSVQLLPRQLELDNKAEQKEIKLFKQCFEQVERIARKFTVPVFFISSSMVFSGAKRIYKESDKPEPLHPVAHAYADCEKLLAKKTRKHIILRSSWLYAPKGNNFLTEVIERTMADELLSFNSAAKGCPTAVDDLARVIIAMLLQLELDVEDAWGIYHYNSSDAALGFQFVEAVVAQASQFDSRMSPEHLHFEHNAEQQGALYFEPIVLSCQKILADFGIHQKPWRSLISAAVKNYFAEQEEKEVL